MKLTEQVVKEISNIKQEPKWMTDFRVNSYKSFIKHKEPNFGPKLNIDYDSITYYKKREQELTNNWNNVNCKVRDLFDDLGVIKEEKNYLD